MTNTAPKTNWLKDYQPPAYLIESIDLEFDLYEDHAIVKSYMNCKINPENADSSKPFECFGEELELLSIHLDGNPLSNKDFTVKDDSLSIKNVPSRFNLDIVTKIFPQKNKSLEGLYRSGKIFCTQCEAEGFRRITFFPDKPDILTTFSTKISADKKNYPVLLSNGNLIEKGDLENGRHWVKWADPTRKPCYLFALVAGDLVAIEDAFTTRSGRNVKLQIFVEEENQDKCDHAMESLKQSMRWDEEVYGREYDLDIFMIVAVNDFNAGAMENKGLNIFNSALVLAKPDTATDRDYERITGVVAHEYFHNWTGNRITCRDWFQLSLKEGLTIFRDQDFSADLTSKASKRISDVNFLRTVQFAEDAGPMAHPVRPESYIEINNFYTVTVYHKGAELIRMMSILLGEKGFFKGMDLYFERHDGQAVTIEDFAKAMEDANEVNLEHFKLWYSQAGTPELKMTSEFDANNKELHLHFSQECSPSPGQKVKKPFLIPIALGLVGEDGNAVIPQLKENDNKNSSDTIVLELTEANHTYTFVGLNKKPVVSVLRNFSAPVRLQHDLTDEELLFLMSNDSDDFNRWESAQQVMTKTILRLLESSAAKNLSEKDLDITIPDYIQGIVEAIKKTLGNTSLDKDIASLTLSLPGESYLMDQLDTIDIDAIHLVREKVKKHIALAVRNELLQTYQSLHGADKVGYDPESAGIRALKNTCLEYLMTTGEQHIKEICLKQFQEAKTMTDEMKALTCIVNEDAEKKAEVVDSFYQKWNGDTLIMDIWLTIQASSKITKVADIQSLINHPVFDYKNPNKVRSLIGAFINANLVNFHSADGSGYQFLFDQIAKLNDINPQIAARLVTPFTRWKKFDQNRQELIKTELMNILEIRSLSKDVYELATKSLA